MASALISGVLPFSAGLTRSLTIGSVLCRSHLPNVPKQPLKPFNKFFLMERDGIVAANKDASPQDLARKLGQLWRELPDERKNAIKDEYYVEMAAWKEKRAAVEAHLQKANLLEDVKAKMKEEKLTRAIRKAKRKQKELSTELGQPKPPTTAFGYVYVLKRYYQAL